VGKDTLDATFVDPEGTSSKANSDVEEVEHDSYEPPLKKKKSQGIRMNSMKKMMKKSGRVCLVRWASFNSLVIFEP
jgi:hypothetical protein